MFEDQNSKFKDTLGSLLRGHRKKARLTQLKLAVIVSVDHSMISKWEKGTFFPSRAQIQSISQALNLTDDASDDLLFAWSREQHHINKSLLTLDSGELIESILTSIRAARDLRNSGNARAAEQISGRDTRQAIYQIRAMNWSNHHDEMLLLASELLLENVKANLDFLTRDSVRSGALNDQIGWLTKIEQATAEDKVKFFASLAGEANNYVGGDVAAAFKNSQKLLKLELDIPLNWRLELLRATAINAGKIMDSGVLTSADEQIQQFLANYTGDLSIDEHTFLLEGLSRGWAIAKPEKALETIEKAWNLRKNAGRGEKKSELRFVQLVRTHAEIEVRYQSERLSPEVKMLVKRAIQISKRNGYDRYVEQLNSLLGFDQET